MTRHQDMEDIFHIKQNEGTENTAELKPHILLLQKFLGHQFVERFLDPSYGIPVSPVQPLHLKTEGCGAKDYWRLLREHSEARLTQHIADLGGTSMVKSSILNQLPPSKLLDKIKDYRRKLWLMSRASELNQEKAILSMANNPLPDENEWQTTSFSPRYLHKDTFLVKKIKQFEKSFNLPVLKTTYTMCAQNKHLRKIETTVVGNSYSDNSLQRPRLNIKNSYNHLPLIQQSINQIDVDDSLCKDTNYGGKSGWEPLTYTALLDSKPILTGSGKGHFRHGQPSQWLVSHHQSTISNLPASRLFLKM